MPSTRPGVPPTTPLSPRRIPAWIGATLTAVVAAGTLLPGAAFAGRLHPALQEELSSLSLNDQATAIIVLKDQVDLDALQASLRARRANRAEWHREVVLALQEKAAESQATLLRELEAKKQSGLVEGYTPYWISNLVVVRAQRATIEELANRFDVEQVERNFKPLLIEPIAPATPGDGQSPLTAIGITPGVKAINANKVWYELDIRGEGALVANMDTGVDGNHNALKTRWRGFGGAQPWQECWLDVLGTNTQQPTDTGGHGTHVMGSITGLAVNDTIGVSPGSQWIACNAINQGVGSGFDNDVIQCFQWLADPDGNAGTVDDVPDVVQNSWRINEGFGGNYTDCDTRWNAAIDGCEASGVVVTFSAGNEGPGSQTIGSPSDRATTLYNVFSVGAVDCTNDNTFPYNIAGFSSRGPTGCNVPADHKIKPEICGPGVDVYSSWPGGSYTLLSGTSMSGPHLAGVVGLMRSVNPDLPVEDVKRILMETARDEGTAGEDNTYGWGFVDAYEAVLQSAVGYGQIAGTVTNASNGGTPIPSAQVNLVEAARVFTANGLGAYQGSAPAGTYTVTCSHPSFATQTVLNLTLTAGQLTTQNFSLTDTGAPAISNVRYESTIENEANPIPVTAAITDFSVLNVKEVVYRVNGGAFSSVPMSFVSGSDYVGNIPPQHIGDHIEFYIHATDNVGNSGVDPANAPLGTYDILLSQTFFTDNAETDKGWSFSSGGDSGVGTWTRNDPLGTYYVAQQQQCEPADDHTPAPGVNCFFTKQGTSGGSPGQSDVDNGCVTLTSPAIDLSNASEAIVSYWRWWARLGPSQSGSFEVAVSSNNGSTWVTIETLSTTVNAWTEKSFDVSDFITFSSQVKFRFKACDTGDDDLVEAAIDDFAVDGVLNPPVDVAEIPTVGSYLFVNRPNPATPQTMIRYRLAASSPATITIYDASGRQVRSLVNGVQAAGEHATVWDGRDDNGRPVASGVYLYRLQNEQFQAERKMLLVR
ncbi:MAG: S8 family serine peptidase [Candidatus Eisenbacteria bacterium]|nr:S8 family serine peptidase [Candidatus Eisenbacteria bacterium]